MPSKQGLTVKLDLFFLKKKKGKKKKEKKRTVVKTKIGSHYIEQH